MGKICQRVTTDDAIESRRKQLWKTELVNNAPYTNPSEDIAPSPPPSFKKNPAKDDPVKTTPIENTTNGREKPLISKGTVSLR